MWQTAPPSWPQEESKRGLGGSKSAPGPKRAPKEVWKATNAKNKNIKKPVVLSEFGASWLPQEGSKGARLEPLGGLLGDLRAIWGGLVEAR